MVGYERYGPDTDWAATAINWVVNDGNSRAEVINCSWGGQGTASTNLQNAINNALTNGRGGKGCVVVASSGNNGVSTVGSPANLSGVIAVGAIMRNGTRRSNSNYGTGLDVVAPGDGIFTTDRQGSAGYEKYSYAGNYCSDFGMTSAAAPHVSGIAALMLSVYPNLTASQVQEIIKVTARNNSSPNSETGWGLVNAHAAVSLAANPATVQNAFDFVVYNYTSQDLNNVYVGLNGAVRTHSVSMFSASINSLNQGQSAGYPNYPGTMFSTYPTIPIIHLSLSVSVSGATSQNMRVMARVSTGGTTFGTMQHGNIIMALPNVAGPHTNGQRRTVYIYLEE
jgi:subtilisin family serine protease